MRKITFPLKLRIQGPEVGDLQAALQLFLERGLLLARDEAARRKLAAALQRERTAQSHGPTTAGLVNTFQREPQWGRLLRRT
jgi:hypothetical protein